MKISLEWLRSLTPGPLDPQAAADALTNGGLNVDAVIGSGDAAVLEVEVTSNRPDCLSHIGVAREVAALMSRRFVAPDVSAAEESTPAASLIKIRIDAPQLCPHYTARIIRGVKIGPSPQWMTERLLAVGVRPINNVVDVTNYILMEMGQPLHAFDLARIGGAEIVVRNALAGERMTTLDGKTQSLQPYMLVIADQSQPVALAGVMGGEGSQVCNATTDILLESARFDPLCVRRTSRALSLRSESSYRFERGLDTTLPIRASLRAAQLILETAGGQLAAGIVQAGAEGYAPKTLSLRLAHLQRLLGVAFPADKVLDALARLQLSPVLHGDRVQIKVPSWRLDLNIEADLIEEVARVIGYDALPIRDEISIRLQPPDREGAILENIRQSLVVAGYFEAVTFSFVSDPLRDDFFPAGTKPLKADVSVRKADATLRPSLLPGLLEAAARNQSNGTPDARLFEIGSTFLAASTGPASGPASVPSSGVDERRRVGMLASGGDWRDLRGSIEVLLAKLNPDHKPRFIPDDRIGFTAGGCARVEWNGKPIGFAGQIDRPIAEKLSLRGSPMAAELELSAMISSAADITPLKAMPQFPAARRDLSLVVDESVPYERIEQTLIDSKLADLEQIEYLTTFRGKPLEAGKKSVSVTLVFRSESTTLTGEQVESSVTAAFNAAAKSLGATLRQ